MDAAFSIFVLALYAAVGLLIAFAIARRVDRPLNFRTLLIVNYVLVMMVSGIVHLAGVEGQPRGFYDVLATNGDELMVSVLGSVLGLAAVCAGCLVRLPKRSSTAHPKMTTGDRWAIFIPMIIVAPLALTALQTMFSYVGDAETVRLIAVDQGYARFVFMSHWMVWVISFGALWLMSIRVLRSTFWQIVILGGAVVGIVYALSWTGGRSIALMMCLPLLLVAAYTVRKARWLAVPVVIVAGVTYVVSLTSARLQGTRQSSSLATWLDWEWGRFSMLGFAETRVHQEGFLMGETFYAGISNVLLGVLRLAGIPIMNPAAQSMPEITGRWILGNDQTYVVAGYTSELYINFGYVGIAVGLFILALVVGWVDRRFSTAGNLLTQFAWGYLGVLLIFRTLAADANALGSYLIYSGVPVLAVALLANLFRARAARRKGGSVNRRPSSYALASAASASAK